MNILEEIAAKTRDRIREEKQKLPLFELRARAEFLCSPSGPRPSPLLSFEDALRSPGISFICEIKKASPSKGVIAEHFPYLQIAKEYEMANASAISCLTEPFWFQGSDQYLKEIAGRASIPVLRKDFTIDEYMIYQARAFGASAVLLICAILSDAQLKDYLALSRGLGLSALVEAHTAEEVERALRAGAGIIGVNNRDLKTFQVDLSISLRLRKMVPENILFVSESGIQTSEHIMALMANGVNAVLIGETLMREKDKKAALDKLRGTAWQLRQDKTAASFNPGP